MSREVKIPSRFVRVWKKITSFKKEPRPIIKKKKQKSGPTVHTKYVRAKI